LKCNWWGLGEGLGDGLKVCLGSKYPTLATKAKTWLGWGIRHPVVDRGKRKGWRTEARAIPPFRRDCKPRVLRLRCASLRMTERMGHGALHAEWLLLITRSLKRDLGHPAENSGQRLEGPFRLDGPFCWSLDDLVHSESKGCVCGRAGRVVPLPGDSECIGSRSGSCDAGAG
jgi:hypothetical protein